MKIKNLFSALFRGDHTNEQADAEGKSGSIPEDINGLTPFEPAPNILERRISTLIATGKIPEAIQVLLDAGHTEAASVKNRWDSLQEQQALGLINGETFIVVRNQILYAISECSRPSKEDHSEKHNKPSKITNSLPLSAGQRDQLRELLKQEKLEEALELGKEWDNNNLTILCGRFSHLKRDHAEGLLSQSHYEMEMKRIRAGLEYFISH